MNDNIRYRQANSADIPFLVETIFEAEKSGAVCCANQILFDLDDDSYRLLLHKMLAEDVPGSEYCPSNFVIAHNGQKAAGAMAIWLEGTGSKSSNMIKASLLSHFTGIEKWKNALDGMALLASVLIPRRAGTLQIDAGYVDPEFRGLSISTGMNIYALAQMKNKFPDVSVVQVSCIIENEKSLHALHKTGFVEVARKKSDNPGITRFIPGTGFVQLELNINNLVII